MSESAEKMITITMSYRNWATMLEFCARLGLEEILAINRKVVDIISTLKVEKESDDVSVAISVEEVNKYLNVMKCAPFYLSFDIVQTLFVQGQEQLKQEE